MDLPSRSSKLAMRNSFIQDPSSLLRDGAMRNSLMQMLATPHSDMILNRQNADTDKMVRYMESRKENPVLVIPVDKLTKEHVDIDRPLFFTFRHHAEFGGHTQYKVDGNPMNITELKSFYKTKDGIMDHLKRVGKFETITHAAHFVVNARNVDEAIRSVQDYAKENRETFFKCSSASSASSASTSSNQYDHCYAHHAGGRTRKYKGKRKGKSQKRKCSRKMI